MDLKETSNLEEDPRDIAFQTVSALRDTVFIATRKPHPPTYEQSLRLVHDLDEKLYENYVNLLTEKNDSDVVKLYKEEAKIQGKNIVELIELDINKYTELEQEGKKNGENTRLIKNKLISLYAALENIKPRSVNENAVLLRDFSPAVRSPTGGMRAGDYGLIRSIKHKQAGDYGPPINPRKLPPLTRQFPLFLA